jgi:hypothetical protein
LKITAVSECENGRVRAKGNAERVRRCLCAVCQGGAVSLSRRLFQLASSPCPSALDAALETPAQTHLRQSAPIPLPAYRSKSTPVALICSLASGHVYRLLPPTTCTLGSILPFHALPICVSRRLHHTKFQFYLLCLLLIIYPVFNSPLPLLPLRLDMLSQHSAHPPAHLFLVRPIFCPHLL